MLTKEDMKNINNKLRGTGKYMDTPMYDTLRNSANGFLITDAPVAALIEEVEAPQYKIDIAIQEQPVKQEVKIEQPGIEVDLNVPYFLTPFYMECKMEAKRQGTTVDAIAFEKLAKQLNITVRRAVRLVQEGLIEVRF